MRWLTGSTNKTRIWFVVTAAGISKNQDTPFCVQDMKGVWMASYVCRNCGTYVIPGYSDIPGVPCPACGYIARQCRTTTYPPGTIIAHYTGDSTDDASGSNPSSRFSHLDPSVDDIDPSEIGGTD